MRAIKRYGVIIGGILVLVGALLAGAVAWPALARVAPGGVSTPAAVAGSGGLGGGMRGRGDAGSGPGGMMSGSAGTPASPTTPRWSGPQVRQAVATYLSTSYPGQNLAIAEILEFQNNFYARIQEPATGSNAYELLVDPYWGTVGPEYGPNMMWNTKYGPMAGGAGGMMGGGMMGGGMMGGCASPQAPTADMPVTPAQAVQAAQQYLQAQGSALTVESVPDRFYGYYTFETLQDGATVGMLSVNGYTGQVWAHTWHGVFLSRVGADN